MRIFSPRQLPRGATPFPPAQRLLAQTTRPISMPQVGLLAKTSDVPRVRHSRLWLSSGVALGGGAGGDAYYCNDGEQTVDPAPSAESQSNQHQEPARKALETLTACCVSCDGALEELRRARACFARADWDGAKHFASMVLLCDLGDSRKVASIKVSALRGLLDELIDASK